MNRSGHAAKSKRYTDMLFRAALKSLSSHIYFV
jgi:hypothetical protein